MTGKASAKRDVILRALRTEVERRYGQQMSYLNTVDGEYFSGHVYALYQDNKKLSFVVTDWGNVCIGFNKDWLERTRSYY